MTGYKQVIVLRSDIEMSEGKKIAQACHASLRAFQKASSDAQSSWSSAGSAKIVLESDDLENLRRRAESRNLPAHLVRDAGRTELEEGTVTALGIGPARKSEIDPLTGDLGLVG